MYPSLRLSTVLSPLSERLERFAISKGGTGPSLTVVCRAMKKCF